MALLGSYSNITVKIGGTARQSSFHSKGRFFIRSRVYEKVISTGFSVVTSGGM